MPKDSVDYCNIASAYSHRQRNPGRTALSASEGNCAMVLRLVADARIKADIEDNAGKLAKLKIQAHVKLKLKRNFGMAPSSSDNERTFHWVGRGRPHQS
jgi:hypothetical protein